MSIYSFEPLLPQDPTGLLRDLSIEVIRESARLSGSLHPLTCQAITELVRTMNCYYSNLIENHHTLPLDIERALDNDYDEDQQKRDLQLESVAHIKVQKLIEARLHDDPGLDIFQQNFITWVHQEFFSRLPPSMLFCRDKAENKEKIVPGRLRERDVIVGQHVGPAQENIKTLLTKFHDAYWKINNPVGRILATAAAHHRLLWIHPFLDGNGRVARLFTDACLLKANISGYGIWVISRGLARNKEDYKRTLTQADAKRKGDLDGRGNLSDSGLREFCLFFLQTALDQIAFMKDLLDPDGIQQRILAYAEYKAIIGLLKKEAGLVLREVFLRGKIDRGEVTRITGKPERSARRILKELLDQNLLLATSPKGPVQLAIPTEAAEYYFPNLFAKS